MQGDHGSQRLHFIDFIFEALQPFPSTLLFLRYSHQPKQNGAESGTTEVE